MVQYTCTKCNKTFILKGDYVRHMNRKISCIDGEKSDNDAENTEADENKLTIINKNFQKFSENANSEIKSDNECIYCNKKLCNKYTLDRHQKTCKSRNKQKQAEEDKYVILMKQINELKTINENQKNDFVKQINELKELCKNNKSQRAETINNNITNNNTTNNQQINININAFADTDMSFLSNEDIKLLLRKGEDSVVSLVDIVHFDKNRPENHNIYISNIKEPYILLYDGKEWKRCDRDNTIEELYEDKSAFLSDKCIDMKNNKIMDETTTRKFEGFQNNMDGYFDESKMRNRIIANLGSHLHNKRDIPMKTRKIVKQNNPNKLEHQIEKSM